MSILDRFTALVIHEGIKSYKNNSIDLGKSAKTITKELIKDTVRKSDSLQGLALTGLYAEKQIDTYKKVYNQVSKKNTLKNCARYGNVIYVYRKGGLYMHFGVYLSDNYIIHFSDTGNDFGNNICIRKIDLKGFLGGEQDYYVCVYPKTSNTPGYHLYSAKETVNRAKSLLGKQQYNLVTNNCEHFATWCKTGISDSQQVDNVISLARSLKCNIDMLINC